MGRELDAYLAEHLLDWPPDLVRPDGVSVAECMAAFSGADWELVAEQMRERGWIVTIQISPASVCGPGGLQPYFCVCHLGKRSFDASADTVGQAVAMAAYQALQGKRSDAD